MKNYLELIPITAKIHKKQNRMSVFCIILAVFLVTAIFGMADMFIRSQLLQTMKEYGNWHVFLRNITDEQAALAAVRPEVAHSFWYGVINYREDQNITTAGKNVIIIGSEAELLTETFADSIKDGSFPQREDEALLSENAAAALGIQIGSQIQIDLPDGANISYTITGLLTNQPQLMKNDSYGLCLTTAAYRSLYRTLYPDASGLTSGEEYNSVFYVQFSAGHNIREAIETLKSEYGLADEQVSENVQLMGLLGSSSSAFMLQIYAVAAVLFVLVLIFGIIMITSSLNSNIVQRIEFFGLMRCIGATPRQVKKFVRREALRWCRTAIPTGIGLGVMMIWILSGMLRYLTPHYFGEMPALGISLPSVLSGVCLGLLTVILSAQAPAKRAAKVSPLAAVSGNAGTVIPVKTPANTAFLKIDTALGIHHAHAVRKNFFLMVSSFALSIILFLSFSVTVDFMHHAIAPVKPWAPDLSIVSPDKTCSVDAQFLEDLQQNPAVKRAFGRMFAYDVPVTINGEEQRLHLISYDENQFNWAEDYLLAGSVAAARNEAAAGLIVFQPEQDVQVGEQITLEWAEAAYPVTVAGLLSTSPFFNSDGGITLICSESTFRQITGFEDYTIIDIQLTGEASETDVEAIRGLAGTAFLFSDNRLSKLNAIGAFYSFGFFIYGFMGVIALITVFNIINSISMSVAARMKQYGAFRAIGLSNRQLLKMITAEALTYAVTGSIIGGILGLMLNKLLFNKLVSFQWGEPWSIPLPEIAVIITIVTASVVLAVRIPAKRLRSMSIVDTINVK